MKKMFAILAAFAMMAGNVLTVSADDKYGPMTYSIYEEQVYIVGCDDSAVDILIPSDIEGYPVYAVADDAFREHVNLTAVHFRDNTAVIGYCAFYECTNLTEVDLPDTLESIGQQAFANNVNLEQITLPEGLVEIQYGAFMDCSSLKSVSIPDSVTLLDDSAFNNCRDLTDVKLSANLQRIEENLFADCVRLQSISIPDSVTAIGAAAFSGCKSLRSIEIPRSVAYIGYIPGEVWFGNTFYGCDALTDIYYAGTEADWNLIDIQTELPEGVTVHYAEEAPSTGGTLVGDHNHDGVVDASDATVILQYCAELGAGNTNLPLDKWYALQNEE